MRDISAKLPANLGMSGSQVQRLLDGLTDHALRNVQAIAPRMDPAKLPAELRLRNGQSALEAPGGQRYAAPGTPAAEREMIRAAQVRGAFAMDLDTANALLAAHANGEELGADQRAAVQGIATSGAQVETLLAAAGTGKSYVVSSLDKLWSANGQRLFGLAPSQSAADVLRDEGVTSANVDAWLLAQRRLAGAKEREEDSQYRLRTGDLVVVDEAGMASTTQLLEVQNRCNAVGVKLLLVGDHRQLGAVGAGGVLADVAKHGHRTYELTEVRRFTEQWERTASLGLRDGDPNALDEYLARGRLLAQGTPEEAEHSALRAWVGDLLQGRDSLMIASTNATAEKLSAAARAKLAELGMLNTDGPSVRLGRDANLAGVGDLVQARRNDRDMEGRAAVNRTNYRITEVHEDGSVTVVPVMGRFDGQEMLGEPQKMPAEYVAQHMALAYASTVHAAQGRTVDTCHAIVDGRMGPDAAYVAMTRGRHGNFAHVATREYDQAKPTGEALTVEPRAARAKMAELLERDNHDTSSLQQMHQAGEQFASVQTNVGHVLSQSRRFFASHTSSVLDKLTAEGLLSEDDRRRLAADDATPAVDRILRSAELAGHDRETLLRRAMARGNFADARSAGQALYSRVQGSVSKNLRPTIGSFHDLLPANATGKWKEALSEWAATADERRRDLGGRLGEKPEPWVVDALGPVPTDDILRRIEWEEKAGWAAAARELAGHTDPNDALGPPPPAGLAEKYAVWRTAHAMLDLPEAGADEREMTLGGLRNRIAAYQREERWAPRHVAAELGQTNREAQQAETNAQIWKARADQLDNPQDAEELRARADQALLTAGELRMRAADLQKADDARALWWAHTTATREAAERAKVELASRGIDVNDTSDHVTGEEWLAEQERLRAQEEAQLAASMQALPDEELVDEPEPAAAETNAEPAETLDPAGESEADDDIAAAPPDDADTTVDDADTPPREDRANDREDEPVDREDDREEPANAQVDEPAADGSQPTPEPQRDADQDEPEPAAADQDDEPEPAKPWVETDVPDIRDTAKPDPTEHADPSPRDRVPERDEAAEAVERAHQALLEMQQRAEEDRWREEREKNERAAQWADTDDDEPAAKDADVPELVDD